MEKKSNNNNDNKRITNSVVDNKGNIVEFDIDKESKFPFLLRRLLEILISSVIASLPFALLYTFGFDLNSNLAIKFVGLSLLIFVILNFYLLRSFFYGMGNLKVYFKVNYLAYSIYAIVDILAVSLILGFDLQNGLGLSSPYSFVFMPIQYANLLLGQLVSTMEPKYIILSTIMVHLGLFLVVLISPLEMYAFEKNKRSKRN